MDWTGTETSNWPSSPSGSSSSSSYSVSSSMSTCKVKASDGCTQRLRLQTKVRHPCSPSLLQAPPPPLPPPSCYWRHDRKQTANEKTTPLLLFLPLSILLILPSSLTLPSVFLRLRLPGCPQRWPRKHSIGCLTHVKNTEPRRGIFGGLFYLIDRCLSQSQSSVLSFRIVMNFNLFLCCCSNSAALFWLFLSTLVQWKRNLWLM